MDFIFKDINEENKYKRYSELKGTEYHEYVANFLQTKIYSEIGTAIQYDLRIKYILYRYISFFEEYIRALMMNNNIKDVNYFLTNDISMSALQQMYYKNIDSIKENDSNVSKIPSNEFDGIRDIRNQTSHFKPLIFDNFEINKQNISYLYNNLPVNYKSNFKNEINTCANEEGLIEKIKIII